MAQNIEDYNEYVRINGGINSNKPITTTAASGSGAHTITSASANALAVGANGQTNPGLQVDASATNAATGIAIQSLAQGNAVLLNVISPATNETLGITAKGSGAVISFSRTGVNVGNGQALAVGLAGFTNPALNVDTSTASSATGLNIKSAAAGGGVALSVISSGTNESLTINAKGTGTITVQSAIATPAGGSAAASLLFGTTAGFGVYYGSGAPTVSAAQGSLYIRSDGSSTSTRLYVNTNGSTTWTNVTTAA